MRCSGISEQEVTFASSKKVAPTKQQQSKKPAPPTTISSDCPMTPTSATLSGSCVSGRSYIFRGSAKPSASRRKSSTPRTFTPSIPSSTGETTKDNPLMHAIQPDCLSARLYLLGYRSVLCYESIALSAVNFKCQFADIYTFSIIQRNVQQILYLPRL